MTTTRGVVQPGEDLAHGVEVAHEPLLWGHGVPHVHTEAVVKKLVVEELVDDKYLRDHNEEVGRLTEVEEGGVSVVLVVEVLLQIAS